MYNKTTDYPILTNFWYRRKIPPHVLSVFSLSFLLPQFRSGIEPAKYRKEIKIIFIPRLIFIAKNQKKMHTRAGQYGHPFSLALKKIHAQAIVSQLFFNEYCVYILFHLPNQIQIHFI